ncbi:MAG: ethanolamine utilization protein [Planctomycetes bacterium]|nr:ethanolamine utilization protein [Planctomycetota bacterium]
MRTTPLVDWGRNPFEPAGCAPPTLIAADRAAGLRGPLRQLCPGRPGVYGMLDQNGQLIYVGKAKDLRKRLLGYFRKGRDRRTRRIIRQARAIAFEPCSSEFAALHRELDLIRRWRPRWNVQGQPLRRLFAFVCLGRAPAPYLFLSRKPAARSLGCFGPVPLGRRVRDAVRRVNDLFRLRDCPQTLEMIFAEQKQLFHLELSAGCPRHDLGTCLGPCFAACTRDDYSTKVRSAQGFLTGTDRSALAAIEQAMRRAAVAQEYELAASYRDRLASLGWLVEKLDHVRDLRARESYIYPAPDGRGRATWYLIHGGRTAAAIAAPRDAGSALAAADLITATYRQPLSDHILELYEHWDGMCLVRSWFRRHPDERKKVLTSDEALRQCEQW